MNDFDSIWHFLNHRDGTISTVQEKNELEHIYSLIQVNDCRSYLEVGTAEGNSLYAVGHALCGPKPTITYVDYGEKHTEKNREEVIGILKKDKNCFIRGVHGNSQNHQIIKESSILMPFDIVLIDGGHDTHEITADLMSYAPMARKFVIVHDIQLPAVGRIFKWYCEVQQHRKVSAFINSSSFGYGIIDVRKA